MKIFGIILAPFLKYIFKPFKTIVADTDVSVLIKPSDVADACVALVVKQIFGHLFKPAVKIHLNLVILVIGLV